ncbi:MAG TPA: hypothetical protein VM386_00665 [Acidimicrobiales bacterium]|nr:hypothetical protein [Acidimicrobiales bacterium]
MANDDDPTTATPASQTQPLPPTKERAPNPPSKATTGWRPGQVAVVAFLALLLGGAGGALVYFLVDEDSTDDSDLATELTTTTSTTADDESSSSSSTTTEPDSDRPSNAPGATSGRGQDQGGETAVGNSIFTATYQSNEDRSTGAIDVDDDWKVRWDVPTGAVTIEVLDARGGVVETIDAQGQGERTFADGGTYQVEIGTNGSRYTVVITDGP